MWLVAIVLDNAALLHLHFPFKIKTFLKLKKKNLFQFESCNKAYSRLENLKTHLRSHTGGKLDRFKKLFKYLHLTM